MGFVLLTRSSLPGGDLACLSPMPNSSQHDSLPLCVRGSVIGAIAASALPSVLRHPTGPGIERLTKTRIPKTRML